MHTNWASGMIIDEGAANNVCLDFSKGGSCIQTKSEGGWKLSGRRF